MEGAIFTLVSAPTLEAVTAGVKLAYSPSRVIDVLRIAVIPTVAFTADAVFILKDRPTAGSAAGEVAIATVTFVVGSRAVGSVAFADTPTPYRVFPGRQIVLEMTVVAGATGQTAQMNIDVLGRPVHKRDRSTSYFGKLVDTAPLNG